MSVTVCAGISYLVTRILIPSKDVFVLLQMLIINGHENSFGVPSAYPLTEISPWLKSPELLELAELDDGVESFKPYELDVEVDLLLSGIEFRA